MTFAIGSDVFVVLFGEEEETSLDRKSPRSEFIQTFSFPVVAMNFEHEKMNKRKGWKGKRR